MAHEVRLAKWKAYIVQCQLHIIGQSIKNWCRQNDVNEKRYYYWLRRIRLQTAEECGKESNMTQKYNAEDLNNLSQQELVGLVNANCLAPRQARLCRRCQGDEERHPSGGKGLGRRPGTEKNRYNLCL